jgi:UDP-N-acetyl-D-mannosaminuronate dehydrogenase
MLWSLSAVSAEAGGKVRKRAMTLHAPGHGIGGHIPVIPMADE